MACQSSQMSMADSEEASTSGFDQATRQQSHPSSGDREALLRTIDELKDEVDCSVC